METEKDKLVIIIILIHNVKATISIAKNWGLDLFVVLPSDRVRIRSRMAECYKSTEIAPPFLKLYFVILLYRYKGIGKKYCKRLL